MCKLSSPLTGSLEGFLLGYILGLLSLLLLLFNKFIYLLAALGLHCSAWAFSSWGEWGLLFVVVRGLLLAVVSLVAEHRL